MSEYEHEVLRAPYEGYWPFALTTNRKDMKELEKMKKEIEKRGNKK